MENHRNQDGTDSPHLGNREWAVRPETAKTHLQRINLEVRIYRPLVAVYGIARKPLPFHVSKLKTQVNVPKREFLSP